MGSVRLVIVRPGRKVFLPLSLKERLVNNLESLLLHGNEDFREQILNREEKRGKKVNKVRIWHEKEIRFR